MYQRVISVKPLLGLSPLGKQIRAAFLDFHAWSARPWIDKVKETMFEFYKWSTVILSSLLLNQKVFTFFSREVKHLFVV